MIKGLFSHVIGLLYMMSRLREEVSLDIAIFSRCSSFSGKVVVFSIEYYFTGLLVYYL